MRVHYLLLSTGDIKILFQADDRHGGYGVSQETVTSTPPAQILRHQSAKCQDIDRSISQEISQPMDQSAKCQSARGACDYHVVHHILFDVGRAVCEKLLVDQRLIGQGP